MSIWSLGFAAVARSKAQTPVEKARAEYAWRVQSGQIDPNSDEGRKAFDEAEAVAAGEEELKR